MRPARGSALSPPETRFAVDRCAGDWKANESLSPLAERLMALARRLLSGRHRCQVSEDSDLRGGSWLCCSPTRWLL